MDWFFFIVSGSKRTRIWDYHFYVFKLREWIESRVGGEAKRMLSRSVAEPNSLNPDPDPAFQVNLDPGIWWPKSEENNSWKFFPFFKKNIVIYLPLAPGIRINELDLS